MDIINRMSHSLDYNIMKERMLQVFVTFARKLLKSPKKPIDKISNKVLMYYLDKESFEDNVIEAFEIYILLSTLADSSAEAKEKLDRS